MNPCPDDEQLGRLLAEQLTQPEHGAIEQHVESCGTCQSRLARLLQVKPPSETLGDAAKLDPQHAFLELLQRTPFSALRAFLGLASGEAVDAISFPGPPTARGPLGCLETYHILERLGSGSAGIVFKAYEEDLDRFVAIKVLRPELALTQAAREQFLSEARHAARVSHENIASIHAFGLMPGSSLPYSVLEFIEGESLSTLLAREKQLDPMRAAEIVRQAALGLAALHDHSLVHRDIKPSNLLLEAKSGQVKIADFGLARIVYGGAEAEGQASMRSAPIVGTPAYMSPEQIRSARSVDGRSDIYSLGAVLHELLSGEPVFLGAAYNILHQVLHEEPRLPSARRQSVPLPLQAIAMRCLAKEPCERYATASELAVDLECWLAGRKIHARPIGVFRKIRTWVGRNRALAVAWSAAAVAFVCMGLVATAVSARRAEINAEIQGFAAQGRAAREEAQHLLATQALDRGVTLCQQGEVGRGMLWLARSVNLAPVGDDAVEWAARAHVAMWLRQLNTLRTILPHAGSVYQVAFSPDGGSAFTASEGGGIASWEAASGKRTSPTLLEQRPLSVLAISPDGRLYLARGERNDHHIYASADNSIVDYKENESPASAGTFAPDSQSYWTGTDKGTVQAWSITEAKPVQGALNPGRAVSVIAVSPDSATVFTGSGDVGQLWQAASGKKLAQPMRHQGPVTAAAFSPTGRAVLTTSKDHTARLWDMTGKELAPALRHRDKVYAGAFGPDGSMIVTASKDRTARLWRAATGTPIGSPLAHTGEVYAVAISPDGNSVLTGSGDSTARIWAVAERQGLEQLATSETKLRVSMVSRAGGCVFIGNDPETSKLWDWSIGEFLPIPVQCVTGMACDWSPDRRTVLSVDGVRTAWFWDIASGQRLGSGLVHNDRIAAVTFSGDGRIALTGSADKTARLWDVATGKALCEPLGHKGEVRAVAFSPDNGQFLTGTWDGEANLWETATRKPVGTALKQGGGITAVAFSPDGRRFLTASRDSTCLIRDVATQRLIAPPLQHDQAILAAVFSHDGRMVLTAGEDHTARLWEAETGRPIGLPVTHETIVRHVGFGVDSQTILTVADSSDACQLIARTWKVPLPVEGDPERLRLWVQVITGIELEADGSICGLDADTWRQQRDRLEELGGPPIR
jgi:WD40 repeat protein